MERGRVEQGGRAEPVSLAPRTPVQGSVGRVYSRVHMQGHLPVPPQPHVPIGLAPVIGYVATREPQPLEALTPVEREWWEIDDEEDEEWSSRRPAVMKVTAIVVSISLLLAGLGTVLDVILSARLEDVGGSARSVPP